MGNEKERKRETQESDNGPEQGRLAYTIITARNKKREKTKGAGRKSRWEIVHLQTTSQYTTLNPETINHLQTQARENIHRFPNNRRIKERDPK